MRFLRFDPAVLASVQSGTAPELYVGNFSYQALARLKPGVSSFEAGQRRAWDRSARDDDLRSFPRGMTLEDDARRRSSRPNGAAAETRRRRRCRRTCYGSLLGTVGARAPDRVRQRRQPLSRARRRHDSKRSHFELRWGRSRARLAREFCCWRALALGAFSAAHRRSRRCRFRRPASSVDDRRPTDLPRLHAIGDRWRPCSRSRSAISLFWPACCSASSPSLRYRSPNSDHGVERRRTSVERRPRAPSCAERARRLPRSRLALVLLVGARVS